MVLLKLNVGSIRTRVFGFVEIEFWFYRGLDEHSSFMILWCINCYYVLCVKIGSAGESTRGPRTRSMAIRERSALQDGRVGELAGAVITGR